MERVKGIEPSYAAWEAAVLPLNYTRERYRKLGCFRHEQRILLDFLQPTNADRHNGSIIVIRGPAGPARWNLGRTVVGTGVY